MHDKSQAFQAQWLLQGYFDLNAREVRQTYMQAIRDELAHRLSVDKVHIKNYPVGANFRHTYWWRFGETDFAEAQFFARIARDHAVLSLGVSVEKGLEAPEALKGRPATHHMNRKTWHWPRLLKNIVGILDTDVAAVQQKLGRPMFLRLVAEPSSSDSERTFAMIGGKWFERYSGPTQPQNIATHLRSVDTKTAVWVNAYLGIDLTYFEVEELTVPRFVDTILAFDGIRRRLVSEA